MDGRKRVLDFIQQGGRKAEASRRFQVSRTAIYQWLAAPDPLTYEKPGPENRDFLTLKPSESMLPTSRIRHLRSERKSSVFLKKASTTPSASVASPEKSLGSKERCPEKRATYQATLAKAIREEKREPVSIDECGFTAETLRIYGYTPRGQRVEDKCSSQQYRQTSLIAARTPEGFTAPLLFKGTCNAQRFND